MNIFIFNCTLTVTLSAAFSRGSVWQKRQKEEKSDKELTGTKLQNSSDLLMMLFSLSMTHFPSSDKSYSDDDDNGGGGGGGSSSGDGDGGDAAVVSHHSYQAIGWTIWGLDLSRCTRFFCSPKPPDWLWYTSKFLFNGY